MSDLLKKTVELAGAYVARNTIPRGDVTRLIANIHATLQTIARYNTLSDSEAAPSQPAPSPAAPPADTVINPTRKRGRPPANKAVVAEVSSEESVQPPASPPEPAVSLEDSITEEYIYCMICGQACKALKGHLDRGHNLDPEAYRRKFGLERDYPMVATSYSEKRRTLALNSGLGLRRHTEQEV
ncbi:MAG: MucR family transcriptional regulator [Magnetococcales bacterium]|nr:MucR family transcriptional regulator [Magnetococcales bacterium]NGZ28290.1 MucR family transcriptional regulator [Magnetococcales bacterium]